MINREREREGLASTCPHIITVSVPYSGSNDSESIALEEAQNDSIQGKTWRWRSGSDVDYSPTQFMTWVLSSELCDDWLLMSTKDAKRE